ncbi:MAG: M15 family metallopeptidase [Gammaproteobacteria bacterium]|nr:M15 family metallopeptidase [Gammaproteobacteria bacterium]
MSTACRALFVFIFCTIAPQASGAKAKIIGIHGFPAGRTHQYIQADTPKIRGMTKFTGISSKTLQPVAGMELRRSAFKAFIALKRKAAMKKIHLHAAFAYRSFATQARLYRKYGKRVAEKPGYSEHHLGTAIDFTRIAFASEAFLWLLKNGIKAGWAPTYYYREHSRFIKEPWHWRYIGRKAARTFYRHWKKAIKQDIKALEVLKQQGKLMKNPNLATGTISDQSWVAPLMAYHNRIGYYAHAKNKK